MANLARYLQKSRSKIIIDIDDEDETVFGDNAEIYDSQEVLEEHNGRSNASDENSLQSWSNTANQVRFGKISQRTSIGYDNMEEITIKQDREDSSSSVRKANPQHTRGASSSSVVSSPILEKKKSTKASRSNSRRKSFLNHPDPDKRRARTSDISHISEIGRSLTMSRIRPSKSALRRPTFKKTAYSAYDRSSWRTARSAASTIDTADDDAGDDEEAEDGPDVESGCDPLASQSDGFRNKPKMSRAEIQAVSTKYIFSSNPNQEPNPSSDEEYGIFKTFKEGRCKNWSQCRIVVSIFSFLSTIILVVMIAINVSNDSRGQKYFPDHNENNGNNSTTDHHTPPMSNDDLMGLLLPISPHLMALSSDSPQRKALQWLKENSLEMPEPVIVRRYILATLFYSTNGQEWIDGHDSWMSVENDCFWKGVVCDEHLVTSLDLSAMGLGGAIPEEIGQFRGLKTMNFHNNLITGSIPVAIEEMVSLEIIDFSDNEIKGVIPNGIGSLSNLVHLNLSRNKLGGEFPDELVNLKQLGTLSLGENEIAGTIPRAIDGLESLRILDLSENEFFSHIPAEIGRLTKLEILNLDDNALDGELPSSLGGLLNLRELIVSRTGLIQGPIPDSLENLSKLEKLYLQDNKLIGPFPTWIQELKNLSEVRLEENSIENAAVPPEICEMKLSVLSTDCGGGNPKVSCSCCSSCFPI